MKLDTQRLILREVEATDVDAMFAWQVDLRYLEHYPVERTSRQDTLDLVGRFIGWKLERPRWRWQLAIAEACSRPVEDVHILFEPPAAGRIAFGGKL